MHIRRPQATDLSGMATLASKAMSDDPITAFVAPYRKPHPECMRLAFFRRAKKRLYSGKYLLIAITDQQDPDWDGTERVVGYLAATSPRWKAEQASQSYFSWNNLELAALSLETFFVDTVGADRSKSLKNQNAFLHELQAAYSTGPFARLEKYWDIDFLAVDPAYHRRGIGKALLGRVQALAAEESVPLTLLATAMGKHLYSHAGFVELCDLGSGSYFLFTAMIWHPEPSTE
ncbi:uncharacterized protein A1O9_01127, partial [Exophiala aquamarina CBS 119918]